MLHALLAILRSSWLLELAGAGLLVAGAAEAWGAPAAMGVGGACLLLKAAELEGKE